MVVVLVFPLVDPVKEGDLAAQGVVQLLPREHVLHHLHINVEFVGFVRLNISMPNCP